MATLTKMQNLQSLNLEELSIAGSKLAEMFQGYYRTYQKHHPLKHLNIKTKMFRWKHKAFQIISEVKKESVLGSNDFQKSDLDSFVSNEPGSNESH
jgi:seryl-tRNA(Sec) selenium transferase